MIGHMHLICQLLWFLLHEILNHHVDDIILLMEMGSFNLLLKSMVRVITLQCETGL